MGQVTSGELGDALLEVAGHECFDQLRYIICDFTAASSVALDPSLIEDLAVYRIGSQFTNGNIRTVIVGGDAVADLVAAMDLEPLRGTREMATFTTMRLAREWLAAQPPLTRVRDTGLSRR